MIRRVRRRFIGITMAMLTLVLLIPLVALNVITEAMRYSQTQELLEQIAVSEVALQEEEQVFPENTPPEIKTERREETRAASTTTAQETTSQAADTTETTSIASETVTQQTTAVGQVTAPQTKTTSQQTTAKTTKTTSATTKTSQNKKTTTTVSRETKGTTAATAASTRTTQTKPTTQTQPVQTQPAEPDWNEEYPDIPWPEDDPWYYETGAVPTLRMTASLSLSQTAIQKVGLLSGQNKNNSPAEPFRKKEETTATIEHFLCFADSNGILVRIEGADDYDYTEEEGQQLLDAVMNTGKTDGRYQNLQFFRKDYSAGTLVVFSDRSAERQLLHQLLWVSILVFFLMEGVVLVLTLALTKRAMRPMQETFERQREFISDAGHELKTPLTIISANVDILQDEIGQNKWLSYIQSQTERMRTLVSDMMNLTKLEMGNPRKEFVNFSLSSAVSSAALPFESQAFEQQKQLILEIQEGLQYTGNPDQIKQLVGIFMDNAMKYSDVNGEIKITLQQMRDKKILKVYNTGKGVPEEEKEKIFQRFYRSDASRARATGGYGLGLSIAQSIAETHKIKIQVESEYEHWICFTLTL